MQHPPQPQPQGQTHPPQGTPGPPGSHTPSTPLRPHPQAQRPGATGPSGQGPHAHPHGHPHQKNMAPRGDPIVTMQRMIFHQIAEVFASPHLITAFRTSSTQPSLPPPQQTALRTTAKNKISVALSQYMIILDTLESELNRAEAVYYRELEALRKRREEQEREERERIEREKGEREKREREEEERREVLREDMQMDAGWGGGFQGGGLGVQDVDMGMDDMGGMGGPFYPIYDN